MQEPDVSRDLYYLNMRSFTESMFAKQSWQQLIGLSSYLLGIDGEMVGGRPS